jgi:peptidoglycan/xylan/chitin deacetylase (PgdA/CDA1 family)
MKPFMPRSLQIILRRQRVRLKLPLYRDIWPINESAGKPPDGWLGWPQGKKFALILSHDVEREKGLWRCHQLIELEKGLGFRSSFNFVAEDYQVPAELRHYITSSGFEVGIHGLHHDGNLYSSKETFYKQAFLINRYLEEWGAVGFRSPSMFHDLNLLQGLNIDYDASTFDTDPFEPQPEGVNTIFPFWVRDDYEEKGYTELPYTMPQDFTLFIIMGNKNIDIWKNKLDWIAEKGGMAFLNTHPDYMTFNDEWTSAEEYPVRYYKELLEHIEKQYKGQYWNVLPKDIAGFWKKVMIGQGKERCNANTILAE